MVAAQQHAATRLGLETGGRRVWGYAGRTLSAAAGAYWLRVVCAEEGVAAGGKLWDGPLASRTLPAAVPRPELLDVQDWTAHGCAYRAELYARAPDLVVAPRPVLDEDPGLPGTWWKTMTTALHTLAEVPSPTDREVVREEYLRRVVAQFTGHQVRTITWSTAHGDLHYANVTRTPQILDWEGWGRAPYGYDAATLYLYALLAPAAAADVRAELAPILDRPEARTGLLTVCAQVLQAQDRTDFYAELAEPVRQYLALL
jgi:hypothetical protein